jgi:hypothetical protein
MPMTLMALLVALLLSPQAKTPSPSSSMQEDVDRLVRAAELLTGTWSSQAPPPISEVALVARHGVRAAPLLVALLSDDPNLERDRRRWKVQQQAALALSRIYEESPHCGRAYCDGDPQERIGRVKEGWLRVIASDAEMRALSTRELLDRFKRETVFWRQLEIDADSTRSQRYSRIAHHVPLVRGFRAGTGPCGRRFGRIATTQRI